MNALLTCTNRTGEEKPKRKSKKASELEEPQEDLLERIKANGKDCIMICSSSSYSYKDIDGDDEDDEEYREHLKMKQQKAEAWAFMKPKKGKPASSSNPKKPAAKPRAKKQTSPKTTSPDKKMLELHSESSKLLRGTQFGSFYSLFIRYADSITKEGEIRTVFD